MTAYLVSILWLVALAGFLRLKDRSSFFSFGIFLSIRAFASFALVALSHGQNASALSVGSIETISFYLYWISYLIGFMAIFFSLQEIFRYVIAPLPGLARLGSICFRWAALVSMLVACASILPSLLRSPHDARVAFVFLEIAAGLCVLELCLVAFLIVAIRAMGLSVRDHAFGICAGLAIMAMGDFVALSTPSADGYGWLPAISETGALVSLLLWTLYFVLPKPQKQSEAVPAAALMEWNDLALVLGREAKEPERAHAGFLHDVEHMVDRVLAKNAAKN
jgi:hypothetical protein